MKKISFPLTGAKDRHILKKTLDKYVKKTIFFKIPKKKGLLIKSRPHL